MVWVLFKRIWHMCVVYLQASLRCTYFWHLKHLGPWDVLRNSHKTKTDLNLHVTMGLVKCQDVDVGLYSFFAFSNGDSSYVCNFPFSQDRCYLLFCIQSQLPTSGHSFVSHRVRLCVWLYGRFSFLICFLPASSCPPWLGSCRSLFFLQLWV